MTVKVSQQVVRIMTDNATNTGERTIKKRALIAGAIGAEIALLAERLNQQAGLEIKETLIDVEVLEVGVGSIDAALTLQHRLLNQNLPRIDEILFIGSAGRHISTVDHDNPAVDLPGSTAGEPAAPSGRKNLPERHDWGFSVRFLRLESSVRQGESRLPPALVSTVETTPGSLGEFLVGRLRPLTGVTNSLDSITLVSVSSEDFNITGPLFENMEAFGVARICELLSLPCSAFFALTNDVGPEGSLQWALNHGRMGLELQRAILEALNLL